MSAPQPPVVPGYRILGPLGRGGMASVYLAIQESVEREVALKIMAPQLSADPTFGERFLREARIAAKLHHRHVVSIFDVGVHDGIHYCAMEHLPGGPVMRRGSPPLALKPTIRCIREIATALHYAQEKGFIHRDVKPDNILLREDGSCVLSDFGIARAADSGTIMTKTGSVVGTPHYMSPEQLRGRAIDGRADLYSLGVVFFQLLSGRVPYEASDSLAVGIMHMTAPLPQFPPEYRILQPILERMLAKEPGDRYQTGAEIDSALADAEKRIAAGGADTPPPQRGAATRPMPPLRAERKPYDAQGSARTEPQIGQLDPDQRDSGPMHATPRPVSRMPTRTAPAPPRRTGTWIALILAVALGSAAYWQRQPLSAWLAAQFAPDGPSEVSVADQAFAAGRLYSADGKDAMAAYTAALMLDSDNAPARRGLQETLRRLYEESRLQPTLDTNRLQDIVRRLTGVRGFDIERTRFQSLLSSGDAPPNIEPKVVETPSNVDVAAATRAESEGRLGGAGGALALYAQAARADVGNAEARRSLDRVAAALAGQARSYLDAGNLDAADAISAELASIPAVAGVAEDLARAIAAKRALVGRGAQIERLLSEARDLQKRGRLIEPRGASAADRYQQVLKLDAGNADAQSGLGTVATAAMVQARAALDERQLERARQQIDRLRALAPRTAGLNDLRERLEDAEKAAKGPKPEDLALRDKLIREGEIALSAEQLVDPPGDSAYDKFRGALRIDPKSDSAKAGMDAVAQALRDRIRTALAAGRVPNAHGDLEALASVASNDAALPRLRTDVARGYAERGLRLLEHDKIAEARNDLASGETLDPSDTKVTELRAALAGAERVGGKQ